MTRERWKLKKADQGTDEARRKSSPRICDQPPVSNLGAATLSHNFLFAYLLRRSSCRMTLDSVKLLSSVLSICWTMDFVWGPN